MRLSDADREFLIEQLKLHAARGALDVAELERRVELVMSAQTRAEASAAVSDLPPSGAAGQRPAGAGTPRIWPARRGHGHADRPGPDWQPTGERFRDPASGRLMRVWVDPAGARHYVIEDGS